MASIAMTAWVWSGVPMTTESISFPHLVEHHPIILEPFRLRVFGEFLARVFFIHIAHRDDIVAQSRHLAHIGPSPAADADPGHVELRIRGKTFCAIQQTSRKNVEQRHARAGAMEKLPSVSFLRLPSFHIDRC